MFGSFATRDPNFGFERPVIKKNSEWNFHSLFFLYSPTEPTETLIALLATQSRACCSLAGRAENPAA
jgi:hypothetical protein